MRVMKGTNDMPTTQLNSLDPEKVEQIIFLLQAISGSLIEITWIMKTIFVMFLIFSAWRLVRK